nr:MAG TPA: hypothetical protein [Caudoviricetes sp.]
MDNPQGINLIFLYFMYKNATIYLDRKYEKYLEFSALNDYQAVSY